MDAWEKTLEKFYKLIGTTDEFKLATLYNERINCGEVNEPIIYLNNEETFDKLIWERNVTAKNVLESAYKGLYDRNDAFVRVYSDGLLETANSIYNWVPVEEWIEALEKAKKPIVETDINLYSCLEDILSADLREGADCEVLYNCECFDGYAICSLCAYENQGFPYRKVRVKYPTMAEVRASEEMCHNILKYRGLYDCTAKDITYGDIMMCYAELAEKPKRTIFVICRDYAYEKNDSYEKGTLGAFTSLEDAQSALDDLAQEGKDGVPSHFNMEEDIETEHSDMSFSLWWGGRYPEYHYDVWIEKVTLQ